MLMLLNFWSIGEIAPFYRIEKALFYIPIYEWQELFVAAYMEYMENCEKNDYRFLLHS